MCLVRALLLSALFTARLARRLDRRRDNLRGSGDAILRDFHALVGAEAIFAGLHFGRTLLHVAFGVEEDHFLDFQVAVRVFSKEMGQVPLLRLLARLRAGGALTIALGK